MSASQVSTNRNEPTIALGAQAQLFNQSTGIRANVYYRCQQIAHCTCDQIASHRQDSIMFIANVNLLLKSQVPIMHNA